MDDEVPSSDNHAGFSGPPGDTQAPVASDIEQVSFSGFFFPCSFH